MAVCIENFNAILRGGQRGSFVRFLDGNRRVDRFNFYRSNPPDTRELCLEYANWDWEEEEEDSDNSGTSMAALPSGNTFIPRGRFRAPALELGY